MKTCVVTGGAGFIGNHLIKQLLSTYKVVCIDNFSSGQKRNIEPFIGHPHFTFREHDLTSPLQIEEVDYLFHLASRASPRDFSRFPIDILLTNSLGTLHMLEAARENGARFLLASTSEIYGNPLEHPQSEKYFGNVSSIGPRSCYDEGKRFAEALTMAFHRAYGLDVRIARIFNTYGPGMRMDDGRVIPTFIAQALAGEEITIFGDGKQTRSFCYVEDMVEGLKRLMFTEGLAGEVVNLGSETEMRIFELSHLIKRLIISSSKISFSPLPENDPERRQPDNSKAKKLLGWTPTTSVEEGLRKTIEYFKGFV